MALQGTLDTFALPEVLRLIAATHKTGRLRLTGPRGTGSISVNGGTIGVIEASAAPLAVEPADALFELLRFEQGSFTFDGDAEPAGEEGAGVGDLEALLAEAEGLLVEWQEIESAIPSMDAWVTLLPSPVSAPVSLDQDLWHAVVAIGSGATVRQIADALSLPELPASRAVRALVELGLSSVTAEPPPDVMPARGLRRLESAPIAAPPLRGEPELFVPLDLPSRAPVARPVVSEEPAPAAPDVESLDVDDLMAAFPGLGGSTTEDLRVAAEPVAKGPHDADEVARHLARLSPRAADAVRNAAAGIIEEERATPLRDHDHRDGGDEGDDDREGEGGAEPIDRGLLLKFLSSVKD